MIEFSLALELHLPAHLAESLVPAFFVLWGLCRGRLGCPGPRVQHYTYPRSNSAAAPPDRARA